MAKVLPIGFNGVNEEKRPSANDAESPVFQQTARTVADSSSGNGTSKLNCSEIYTVVLLLIINLANFADRLTVPSMLGSIEKDFKIEDKMVLGLLQTVFVITYMMFSPIFGYLGDRFNRRILMAVGLFVWGTVSLASAFITPNMENGFWIFMFLRAMIGTGEASYVTISPTIISDLFVGRRRTIVLVIYQSTMLLGSGAGYMVASLIRDLTGSWHYSFMVWPPLVYLCMFGLLFMKEPERGKAEGTTNLEPTSYLEDLKYLFKVKSYYCCTFGYTCTVFVIGAISFWAQYFAEYQLQFNDPEADVSSVGFIFGLITILGGVVGAVGGTAFAKFIQRAKCIGGTGDAIACAIGALGAGPLIYFNLGIALYSSLGMWVMIFFTLSFLSINLVLTQEITLQVLIPTRRATGTGVQMMFSHLLGDAISPYIIGLIVDSFRYSLVPPHDLNYYENFVYLQHALLFSSLVCVLGGFFFFFCSLFVIEDKDKATKSALAMSNNKVVLAPGETTATELLSMSPPDYKPGLTEPRAITSPASSGYMSNTNFPSPPPMYSANDNVAEL